MGINSLSATDNSEIQEHDQEVMSLSIHYFCFHVIYLTVNLYNLIFKMAVLNNLLTNS